jgi:dienelactone hydrolase
MPAAAQPPVQPGSSSNQTNWNRDFSSPVAYERSVAPNRARLRRIIGAVDARLPAATLEFVPADAGAAQLAETELFSVHAVRWPVFDGVFGEGLLLQPKAEPVARVVAIPDADQTPELLAGLVPGLAPERQFARRLAENGCEVLVPVLIDRQDNWAGIATINSLTNQPHREWIYRLAAPLGRHVIGYEVQKVMAAVDVLAARRAKSQPREGVPEAQSPKAKVQNAGIGVMGFAEGGLIAFYAAAVDPRIDAVVVGGYFGARRRMWEEPHSRAIFGLLPEFGDAETATLIAPRSLLVEYSPAPEIGGPLKPGESRAGAASGRLATPDYESVETEFERARTLLRPGDPKDFDRLKLFSGTEGMATGPGSDRALTALLNALGVPIEQVTQPGKPPAGLAPGFDPAQRQRRQVMQLEEFTRKLGR